MAAIEQLEHRPHAPTQKAPELAGLKIFDEQSQGFPQEVLDSALGKMEIPDEEKRLLLIINWWMDNPHIPDLAKQVGISPVETQRNVDAAFDKWEELEPEWNSLQLTAARIEKEKKKANPPKYSLKDPEIRAQKLAEVKEHRKQGLSKALIAEMTSLTPRQVTILSSELVNAGKATKRNPGRKYLPKRDSFSTS